MEENNIQLTKTHKKIERIVLIISTIYTVAMFIVAQMSGWSLVVKEIMFATMIGGWFVYFRKSADYNFCAKFIAAMAWINIVIYALHTGDFITMLSTMAGLIVLLGIFCIPEIIYGGVIIATFIFIYHGFIARTISVTSVDSAIKVFLQILSVYTVSGITWIMIRTQQETSEQLIENIRELEIAERSKDDFMVNVSHEIRTPINAVCGMSEAILQENIPTDVRRDVIDIQTAGRNLLSTVSNILDFSELISGKMELVEENYNITSTITDIINMALTLENGRHLELIVDCDANLPSSLLGDEQKLRRIILNLLGNAIKFTKEGGIILRIKSRKEEYGINLVVSVRDSGIGMTQSEMEKIFTSFSQVNSKRNREEGGVGLGLAITQALIRSMGGFITVKSTPGSGSEFLFTIPQKVLDETPIVSIRNKNHLFAAIYINMDKYNYSVVREGYEDSLRHVAEQLGIKFRFCKKLPELKKYMERENYTHIFISWDEYREDREYFDRIAKETNVILILEYGADMHIGSNMLRIYKPFTVLSIAAVFNGQKVVQRDEQHADLRHRFIAPKAKVLVVDDNAMNLKVMARLLLPYQIKVTLAGSGQEALDKLNAMDFDCVFLDHMMPEMDGVETLHKIRQKPGLYFQSLSVIAFTANAIGGAREMFMAEGFDDFIAKPIELSVLERMLRRYIPPHKQIRVDESEEDNTLSMEQKDGKDISDTAVQEASDKENTDKAASEEEARQAEEADRKAMEALSGVGIDVSKGIAYCGDKEGFREILSIYCTEGPKRKELLCHSYDEQDWKNYVITVHALKSNSKGIGANELAELAYNLEMSGKENRIDYILEHHEELIEMHDALLGALANSEFVYPKGQAEEEPEEAEETGQEEKPQPGNEDGSSLEEQMALLKEKLESFEGEGLEDILNKIAGYQVDGVSLEEFAKEVQSKTEDFDFLGAAEVVSSWEEDHRGE
ncbi:MAG: ATP-binding protein [Alistipes sp.]|nr:ATP-binding protein [Alistipes sp.]